MHVGSEPPRRQARQTAAGTDVEETQSVEARGLEHLRERMLRAPDALLVEHGEEARPVAPELEPFAARHLDRVLIACAQCGTGCRKVLHKRCVFYKLWIPGERRRRTAGAASRSDVLPDVPGGERRVEQLQRGIRGPARQHVPERA